MQGQIDFELCAASDVKTCIDAPCRAKLECGLYIDSGKNVGKKPIALRHVDDGLASGNSHLDRRIHRRRTGRIHGDVQPCANREGISKKSVAASFTHKDERLTRVWRRRDKIQLKLSTRCARRWFE